MSTDHTATDLAPTPGQTIGPFYAYALSYAGAHLLVPPALPAAIRMHGTVRDGAGDPVPDALVEIRQADAAGVVSRAEGSLRRDGAPFTGWGRCAVDPAGRYSFTTLEPGPTHPGGAAFFAVTVFARGLLNRLFTRAYVPGDDVALAGDSVLGSLSPDRRSKLIAAREDDGSLRFDVHLQGPEETVFLSYPRHRR